MLKHATEQVMTGLHSKHDVTDALPYTDNDQRGLPQGARSTERLRRSERRCKAVAVQTAAALGPQSSGTPCQETSVPLASPSTANMWLLK